MGISFSCPFAESSDLENEFESVIVKSISFGDNEVKTNTRSISFNGSDSETTIMKSLGSGKMIIEGSISFKTREMETMISVMTPSPDKQKKLFISSISNKSKEMVYQPPRSDTEMEAIPRLPSLDPGKHEAALKLQKVYKSFRTRRKLADCAVLVDQSWWKLLDFAELKRNSISFFEIEKHETAISRWSRAKNRAAKVGKGLSKNGKAQKLALQHWLEAIDPRHRYGHNLHFYYVKWLNCQSREPFFYWLDIGEGKEVNIVEKCPRSKLQQQCIKYLGPMERKTYEVVVENGKLLFLQTGELLDTTGGLKDDKWIFVLSTSKTLYVGKKKKGTFQHSSFLAGGATMSAGRLVVENGILKAVWPHSGHYQPTEENFKDFISFLLENNVDLCEVKMSPVDEENGSLHKQRSSIGLRSNSSEEDLTRKVTNSETGEVSVEDLTQEITHVVEEETGAPSLDRPKSRRFHSFGRKFLNLDVPNNSESIFFDRFETENEAVVSPFGGYETAEEAFTSDQEDMVPKQNLFDKEHEVNEKDMPEESVLQRIDSHKGLNSYHLGKKLSRTWTSGTGPRIGCVGEYPSELRIRALEHVNLSPRSIQHTRRQPSPFLR